jgi:hypothetical protein
MGYASRSGRAHTNPSNPQAFAICDRCGFTYNHVNLRWQFDWRGTSLQNLRLLVCSRCYDEPQEQLRAIVVPADPVPIQNPRIQDYVTAEVDDIFAQTPSTTAPFVGIPVPQGADLTTENGVNITTQPVGPPLGLDPNGIMPLKDITFFDVKLNVASITTIGTDVITVICNAPHGLVTNSQVAVTGTSNNQIMGFYSVTVVNDLVFTYEIIPYQNVVPGSWYTNTTIVATCSVGLPYNYQQIPIIGIGNFNGKSTAYQFVNNSGQPVYFQENNGNIAWWYFNQ